MPEAYLPRRSGATTLHYDEDCPCLGLANGYRPVDPSNHPNAEACGRCVGEVGDKGDQDWNAYRDLAAAAEGGDGADA